MLGYVVQSIKSIVKPARAVDATGLEAGEGLVAKGVNFSWW